MAGKVAPYAFLQFYNARRAGQTIDNPKGWLFRVCHAFSNAHCSLWPSLPLAAGATSAQSATATISGVVADERQGVIAGATVTAVNEATRLTRKATCTNDGYFTTPLL